MKFLDARIQVASMKPMAGGEKFAAKALTVTVMEANGKSTIAALGFEYYGVTEAEAHSRALEAAQDWVSTQ